MLKGSWGWQIWPELTLKYKWLIVFLETWACLGSISPRVLWDPEEGEAIYGKKAQREGQKRKKKDKRQVEVNIYRVPAVNQVFYLLSQCYMQKSFSLIIYSQFIRKESQAQWLRGLPKVTNTGLSESQTLAFPCHGDFHTEPPGQSLPRTPLTGRWDT